jgi:deoxyribodipyrimidine photo-lyase
VYCYDPRFFAASRWGSTKTGPHRAAFLQQCVAGLRGSLQQLGSGLLVAVGPPEALLPAALEGVGPGAGLVLCQEEVTSEEAAVDAAVQRAIKVRAEAVMQPAQTQHAALHHMLLALQLDMCSCKLACR